MEKNISKIKLIQSKIMLLAKISRIILNCILKNKQSFFHKKKTSFDIVIGYNQLYYY